jgi:hypothetical protein
VLPGKTGLPLAGLQEISRPFLGRARHLAQPYRHVPLSSFDFDNARAGNGFVTAIATLELSATITRELSILQPWTTQTARARCFCSGQLEPKPTGVINGPGRQ